MALAPGSINLVGYQADASDGLVFVVLEPVLAGSVITFTDSSFDGTSFGDDGKSWVWTANADLPAGTEVTIKGLQSGELPSSDAGTVAETDSSSDADVTGSVRTFHAYSGSSTNPALLGSVISSGIAGASIPAPAAFSGAPAAPAAEHAFATYHMAEIGGGGSASPSFASFSAVSAPVGSPSSEGGNAPSALADESGFTDGNDVLNNDELYIGTVAMKGGDDVLTNSGVILGSNGVSIDMGDGNDSVTLEEGSQVFGEIRLGAGNDTLTAVDLESDLNIDAGAGNDTVTSGLGDDLIRGGAGNDILDGGEGDDALQGDAGNDRLLGGLGDDFLFGGDGDDTLVGGEGNDRLDGGAGTDTVDYSGDTDGVTVDLKTGKANGIGVGADTLVGIENVIGGSGNDVLIGNAEANAFSGGAGNDRIVIGVGDQASGGEGDDTIEIAAGGGNQWIFVAGDAGDDTVKLFGTGAGAVEATDVETLIVEGGSWAVGGSLSYNAITIKSGGTVTSSIGVDGNDRISVEVGGKLSNGLIWNGGGNAVITNAGEIKTNGRILDVAAGSTGSLVIDNLAGGLLSGAITPTGAGASNAVITLNNAGVIESAVSGRVIDFRDFDANGGKAVINNLAGGIIRKIGGNDADVIRPGVNGTVNNWGTITVSVAGVDAIDFQSDAGGKVNNHVGGLIEGTKHAITGDKGVTVVNDGTLIGRNGSAVNIDSDGSEAGRVFINNSGTMLGLSAELADSDGDAIDIDGLLTLNNSGTIEGRGAEGYHDGEPNVSEGIAIGGGSINNDGRIYGYGRGIQVDNSSNENALGATLIVNRGEIEGGGHGPEGVSPTDAARFDLRGNEAINLVGNYADEVINTSTGHITGGVSMGGGDDRLSNSGLIEATGGSAIDMGAGDDWLWLYTGATVHGTILLGEGNDLVFGTSSAGFTIDAGAGDDQIYMGGYTADADDHILGGAGNDTIYADIGDDFVDGGEGNDFISGGLGNDILKGGAGDDVIKGGAGNDVIDGGAGYDVLDLSDASGPIFVDFGAGYVSGAGIDADSFSGIEKLLFGDGANDVTGGNGDDVFDGGAGNDTLKGGAGDDELLGGIGDDNLAGGSGDDIVDGGEGNDAISGGSGDDQLKGGAGNDVITGGSGDDDITGGAGDDVVTGGSGSDNFHFAAGFGHDTITDFGASDPDLIWFASGVFADFDAMMAHTVQSGADVVITVDADHSITLSGTNLASLAADDFRFS